MNKTPVPDDAGAPPPPDLRFLKALVTVLTGTMIAGLITIVGLLVIRLPDLTPERPALPDGIVLPAGTQAEAVTFGQGWYAVVTGDQEILIFDAETGNLRQTVVIKADR
ncbi:MAG: hypothetical protein H6901_00480 [Rhodobacteraceae bacterium]|nr:hypothetical protein [Paracoccaceae bacterium]MCP5340681.1 hypothetical protein [Paracoccaceae bacterium]